MKTCTTCVHRDAWLGVDKSCVECIGHNLHEEGAPRTASIDELVEMAFTRALNDPTIARWKSVSNMAWHLADKYTAEESPFLAAKMEGVAVVAHRRLLELCMTTEA